MKEPCDKYPDIVEIMVRTEASLKAIMTNHLPHIEADIKNAKNTVKWVLAPLVGLVNGLLIAVILKLFSVI